MAIVRATPEERHRAILEAARDVFAAEGLERARMDEVARRAQVGKGTIYQHFGSKEDLFLAVGSYLIQENLARIEGLIEDVEDPREGLRILLRELITAIETFLPVIGLYFETWTLACSRDDLRQRCIETFRQLYVPARELIARLVRRGQRQRTLAPGRADDIASLLLAIVDGIAYQAVFLLPADALPRLARSAEKLLLNGLDRR